MAIASGPAALVALKALLGETQVRAGTLLHGRRTEPPEGHYLPKGMTPSPDHTRMTPDTLVGGYGSEERYRLHQDPRLAQLFAQAPATVLAGLTDPPSDDVQKYVHASLDLTMQGGTTSGVVYPLAVCDLATEFRFRNVGGASAGAIAAAITAAAELGRSELIGRAPEPAPQAARADPVAVRTGSVLAAHAPPGARADNRGEATRAKPRVRRGFVGLTDIIGWLTQTLPGDAAKDEFRLAQMFRPGADTRAVFRVAIAAMRKRTWALPVLALTAFRWWTRLVAVALMIGTVLLTGWIGGFFSKSGAPFTATIGWGLLCSTAFVATAIGIILLSQGVPLALRRRAEKEKARARGPNDPVERLGRVTSSFGPTRVKVLQPLATGAVLIGFAVAVAYIRPGAYAAAIMVGLAGSFVVLITLGLSLASYVGQLRSTSFGLLAGTAEPVRRRNLLDLIAGTPRQTVELSVVPWLNECLGQLAGLPDTEVLRFGHLWTGADFHERRRTSSAATRAEWRQLADPEHADRRLVNLELMTTDLTRKRPYRFPLASVDPAGPHQHDRAHETLWLCFDQLKDGSAQMFPPQVLAALAEGDSIVARDNAGNQRTLHPLPEPWDLPVIFAVRLSMALPALFQAVRMYRLVQPTPLHDDFGRIILDGGQPLVLPDDDLPVAEEAWFSDGGITSNFPVHFFDAALPRWPTVSLNLGRHPDSAPHQDVSLPQDWDPDHIPVQPLTDSGLSLAKGVFDTAMSWRDNIQSAMPGYRNRIAQVRTRADEGGTNLFMPRQVVASMALRGALAGARLRTRFRNESQWSRFRWLRLRVAVSNLERLRDSTSKRQGFYLDALSGREWVEGERTSFCDQPSDIDIDWYAPLDGFWPSAPRLLNTFAGGYSAPNDEEHNVLTAGVATPQPVLRQVPRE